MAAAVTVEHNTYLAERAVGRYLNWRNNEREPWGTYWEQEKQTRAAEQVIEREAAENTRLRRQAEQVGSFGEILELLSDGQGVSLSPQKFIELYHSLPEGFRSLLIDPVELTDLYWSSEWQRASIYRRESGAFAYLVDSRNRVLRSLPLKPELLAAAAKVGMVNAGSLDDDPAFTGRIFPADLFFETLYQLSESERSELLIDPSILLRLPKPLTRVGLAPMARAEGFGAIGFEHTSSGETMVVTYPALSPSIEQLLWKLRWKDSDTLFNQEKPPYQGNATEGIGLF